MGFQSLKRNSAIAVILALSVIFAPSFGFANEVPALPSECTGTYGEPIDIASGGEATNGNDFIFAGDGNSISIDGGNGNDCILIGSGNVADISGHNGADVIIIGNSNSGEISGDGENGDDFIRVGENNSGDIFGGNGDDTIIYGFGNTGVINGENGENIIIAIPPAPSAEPLPGTFTSIQNITLFSDDAESIFYTTDGAVPDCGEENGELYESPIPVFSTKTITAVGCTEDGYASSAAVLTYTIEKLEVDPADLSSLFDANVFVPTEGMTSDSTTEIVVAQNLEIKVASSSESKIILEKDTVITRFDNEAFDATLLASSETEVGSLAGLGSGVVAVGALQWGIPSLSLEFSNPIEINIFVGADLNGEILNIVRSITGDGDWTSDGIIPPATCVVSGGICAFQATKASFYSATTPVVSSGPVSTGNSSGGNESASASGISGYSQSFASPDEGGAINLSKSGSEIRLNVPRGAVSGNILFSITSAPLETYGEPDLASGLVKAGDLIFEIIAANGNMPVTAFLAPLSVEFHYLESDILNLDENALAIYYFDKTAGAWLALQSRVDAENNIVSALVDHLTVFGLMSRAKPAAPETAVETPAEVKPELEKIVVNQPAPAPAPAGITEAAESARPNSSDGSGEPEIKEKPSAGIIKSGWNLVGSIYNYLQYLLRHFY